MRLAFTAFQFLIVAVAVGACDLPVDPGSDLPDDASAARLGPEIDTGADLSAESGADITGEFDLTARVTSEFSDETVPFAMRVIADQSGEISSGDATVSMELRPPSAPDEPGATTDEPAAIDESGAFRAEVTGYEIPADSSEMLEEDTTADVVLDSQIRNDDCFRGDATITLHDVVTSDTTIPELELQGPFSAHRLGGSCPGEGNTDAGVDAAADTHRGD